MVCFLVFHLAFWRISVTVKKNKPLGFEVIFMSLTTSFIKATESYTTLETAVPAPYLRKSFYAEKAETAKVQIACCGFYRLFLNGKELTKGFLSPYISNPEHYIYYDEYEAVLSAGENVIGIWLGNGFQNTPAGYIWEFDKASFRSAPMVSMILTFGDTCIATDRTFKTAWSPIFRDDYRWGEVYDGSFEQPGWNMPGFDDSRWKPAIETTAPQGELRLCPVEPIRAEKELKPIAVFPASDGGYIYDFGQSNAGLCRLSIDNAKPYQPIHLHHADELKDGTVYLDKIWFAYDNWERDKALVHKDIYVCKGNGPETYMPSFCYHGFRYVKVTGITPEQATPDLLTFVVFHTDLKSKGGFTCSNETVNQIQEAARRSDLSNFHHIPTDCPQREKNGWTADAALSAEQMLLNFGAETAFAEWIRNMCKAQNEQGALPGIVPTAGWGFEWGNGPAWDQALLVIPYCLHKLRGETDLIGEIAPHIAKYLTYLQSRMDERGLLAFGLGDWCQICKVSREEPIKAPLALTDSIVSMDMFRKAACLLEQPEYLTTAEQIKAAVRRHLIDFDTMTAAGNCQSSQAMCIYYDVFTEEEKPAAFAKLLELIGEADDHMDVGVLGARVLFYVLSQFGHTDLALHMIARPDYPSYGNWIARGATTLWEDFIPDSVNSPNHHFWGHVSGWFITNLAGIRLNSPEEVTIQPEFASQLTFAEGWHESPAGKIASRWERKGEKIELSLTIPEAVTAQAILPNGWSFADGSAAKPITNGIYTVKRG